MYSYELDLDENFNNSFFYSNDNKSFDPIIEYNMQNQNQYQYQSFFLDSLEKDQPFEEKIQKNDSIIPLNEINDDINFKDVQEFKTKEEPFVQNFKESKNQKENSENRSTCSNSGHQGKIEIKKQKFKIDNKSEKAPLKDLRFDMVKKHWKSKISNYGTKEINDLIKISDLPKELKKSIHKPNSMKFTSIANVVENSKFLGFNLRTIYTIGSETGNLQKQNKENIDGIFHYLEKIGYENISENLRKIKNFFEMNYKELIIQFYNSNEFNEFKVDNKTIDYDKKTIEQEGFSLLTNHGLIRLFQMVNKKRKRD
jgi:hypothetical protein